MTPQLAHCVDIWMSGVAPLSVEDRTPVPDRVRAITTGNFGRVIGREGNIMTELPADTIPISNCAVQVILVSTFTRSAAASLFMSRIEGEAENICSG